MSCFRDGLIRNSCTVAAFVSVLVLAPVPAHACKCARVPVCQEFWEAALVFIGRAERVARLQPGTELTEFMVTEQLRGERIEGRLVVRADGLGGSCDRSFEQGAEYLVLAKQRDDGNWRVLNCSNTDAIARISRQDLAYVRGVQTTSRLGSLSGVVMIEGVTPRGVKYDALVGARVVLHSRNKQMIRHTERRGSYRFDGIPPGEYILRVELRKDLRPIDSMRVVIGSGECAARSFTTGPR